MEAPMSQADHPEEQATEVWSRCHEDGSTNLCPFERQGDYCKAPRRPFLSELMVNKDFVDELTCAVCLEILVEASTVIPCGHVFCKECIGKLARDHRNRKHCPVCKARLHNESAVPALIVRNMIARMDVLCRYGLSFNIRTGMYEPSPDRTWAGCGVTVKVSLQAAHEDTCPFSIRTCKWRPQGCKFVGVRGDADRHEATCNWRTEPCSWCLKLVPAKDLECHMQYVCKARIEACPNAKHGCTEFPTRGRLRDHLDRTCLFEKLRPFFDAKDTRISELEAELQRLKKQARESGTPPDVKRQCVSPVDRPQSYTAPQEKLSQIFVECSSKKLLSVPVFLSDTPRCLFNKIARAWNISPKQYQLALRRQILDPRQSFASQGVERDSTLRVVPCLDHTADPKAGRTPALEEV